MDAITKQNDATAGKLVFGIVLVVFGITAFFGSIDLWNPHALWRLWPLILIALGIGAEVDLFRRRRGDGGAVLIALGAWFLTATQGFFGLGYARSMPIGIAVFGAVITLHALLIPRAGENDERN